MNMLKDEKIAALNAEERGRIFLSLSVGKRRVGRFRFFSWRAFFFFFFPFF